MEDSLPLTAWFPTYRAESFATSAVTACTLNALYSILASLLRVGGRISDVLGGERTAMISVVILLGGAIGLSFPHWFALAVICAVVMAIGMGVTNAAVFKLSSLPQAVL